MKFTRTHYRHSRSIREEYLVLPSREAKALNSTKKISMAKVAAIQQNTTIGIYQRENPSARCKCHQPLPRGRPITAYYHIRTGVNLIEKGVHRFPPRVHGLSQLARCVTILAAWHRLMESENADRQVHQVGLGHEWSRAF